MKTLQESKWKYSNIQISGKCLESGLFLVGILENQNVNYAAAIIGPFFDSDSLSQLYCLAA